MTTISSISTSYLSIPPNGAGLVNKTPVDNVFKANVPQTSVVETPREQNWSIALLFPDNPSACQMLRTILLAPIVFVVASIILIVAFPILLYSACKHHMDEIERQKAYVRNHFGVEPKYWVE